MKNKLRKKIVIIGAGAAGLAAGISAAQGGAEVCLIEHGEKAGAKLLMTGNGHCNYTNTDISVEHYYGDRSFVREVIEQFTYEDCIEFFKELYVFPKIKKYPYDDTGYVYPQSGEAASVRDALLMRLKQLGVRIFTGTSVEDIEVLKDESFRIRTDKGTFEADSLIVATGSNAYPKTGSDSSFYRFIKAFGHNFYTFMPALSMIKSNDDILKAVKGVRADAEVKLMVYSDNDMMMYDSYGEVQFNEQGVSGIPVMQLSRYVPLYLSRRQNLELIVSLLPEHSREQLTAVLEERYESVRSGAYPAWTMLMGLLPEKLAKAVCDRCNKDVSEGSAYINALIDKLKCIRLRVTKAPGFDQAQICLGGVDTFEIDEHTMESALHKNLYFAGEVLNIDGNCGGYNLHFAFGTGIIAGRSAAGTEV